MLTKQEFIDRVNQIIQHIDYPWNLDFIHTHVHTEYSMLDGAGKVDDIAQKCKDENMPFVMTDHGNVAGTIRALHACEEKKIPYIRGMEAYINKSEDGEEEDYEGSYYHLILLPYTQEGFENINLLSSLGFTEGLKFVFKSPKPVIRKEWLEKYSKGIVAMSACMFGEVSSNIWVHFPYIELLKEINPKYAVQIIRIARKLIERKKILTKKSKLHVDDLSDNDVLNFIIQKKKLSKLKNILLKECTKATNEQIIDVAMNNEDYINSTKDIIEYYGNIFDFFYLEIQDHNFFEQRLTALLCKYIVEKFNLGTKLVITNDVHYINKEDWEVQDVLLCISTRKLINDKTRWKFNEHELYFKTPEQLMEKFQYLSDEEKKEYMKNSTEVVKICLNYEIKLNEIFYPKFDIPEQFKNAGEYLLYLAVEGAKNLSKQMPKTFRYRIFNLIEYEDMKNIIYKNIDFATAMELVKDAKKQSKIIPLIQDSIKKSAEEVINTSLKKKNVSLNTKLYDKYLAAIYRVIYEFSMIIIKEIPDYFLIVRRIINFARENNILVGPGRGSAAGCSIAYLTDITELDPLDYALYFEREDVALRFA